MAHRMKREESVPRRASPLVPPLSPSMEEKGESACEELLQKPPPCILVSSLEIWPSSPIILAPHRRQNCEMKGARPTATNGEERARRKVKPLLSPSRVEPPPRLTSVAVALRPPPFLPPSSCVGRKAPPPCPVRTSGAALELAAK
nr:uncharacterized protein LOC112772182 [Arachis hypogaea]